MGKKYFLTDEIKINSAGVKLHRIQRVDSDEKGGWVEKEYNLSHEGNCWIHGEAEVSGNAKVYGNAQVSGDVQISGDAWFLVMQKPLGIK